MNVTMVGGPGAMNISFRWLVRVRVSECLLGWMDGGWLAGWLAADWMAFIAHSGTPQEPRNSF